MCGNDGCVQNRQKCYDATAASPLQIPSDLISLDPMAVTKVQCRKEAEEEEKVCIRFRGRKKGYVWFWVRKSGCVSFRGRKRRYVRFRGRKRVGGRLCKVLGEEERLCKVLGEEERMCKVLRKEEKVCVRF